MFMINIKFVLIGFFVISQFVGKINLNIYVSLKVFFIHLKFISAVAASSIRCFQCTSLTDLRCGDDFFAHEMLFKCPYRKKFGNATHCRKSINISSCNYVINCFISDFFFAFF